jgi:hypothetical protein
VNDLDADRVRERPWKSIRPFNGRYPSRKRHFIQAKVVDFERPQAVQIYVIQRKASAPIFLYDGECGTADLARIYPKAFGEASNEGGLTGAEITREQYDRPALEGR